ncbi:MAG TPA: hypothetical protein VEY95_10920 [Azospirillaceae bacterium]|nr:hypothetical protein [Azospirillaceae bacterium]
MAVKKNPLGLNPLQLKTLTLLQELARLPDHGEPVDGGVRVTNLPQPHGDHFHLGPSVVLARDATGLHNPAPWAVLERKGLIQSRFPNGAVVTEAGLAYDTGLRDQILHRSGH